MSRPKVPLLLSVVVVCACAVAAAQERSAYFAVNSERTFAPGEHATVNLQARGVDALEFRVYRVKDPAVFFQKLEDLHQFGGHVPRPEHQESALEKLHSFKRHWWVRVRDMIRAQFSRESRARIRENRGAENKKPLSGEHTEFAQIPVLNPQQLVSRWRQELPQARRFEWEWQSVPLEISDQGIYLVEVTNGELRAYTIVIITDLAMIVKTSPGHVMALVVERQSGKPIPQVPVVLWRKQAKPIDLVTDANGIAEGEIKVPNKQDQDQEDEPDEAPSTPEGIFLLARQGQSVAVNSPYSWYLSSDPERDITGYVYTDRPVYRPGHTVEFKAILRQRTPSGYELPSLKTVQVQITAADGKTVMQRQFAVSAAGSLHGEFPVPDNASLGYYSLQVHAGRGYAVGGFHIEEYKKPEYEVRVTPEKARVLQGDPIRATIEARYYFGEPVANAKVKYVLHRSTYWAFDYYYPGEDQAQEDEGGGEYDYGGEQLEEQEGQLDADGKLTITLPTSLSKDKYDLRYRVEARVTDAANREISGHNFVLATYGSYYLTAEPDGYAFTPGATARITINARDYDKHPVQAAVHLEMRPSAIRTSWESGPLAFSTDVQTDANGVAYANVNLRDAGSWTIRATSRTSEGREIERDVWLWVSGGTGYDWGGGERIQLIADKKSYAVGDTAKVLVISGTDAYLLVTTEGSSLRTRQIVHATGGTTTVEVPIVADFQPNIFVSVAFIRDGKLHQGSRSLSVPPVERQLNIEIAPAKEQFRPGEPAAYDVTVKDYKGQPVAAELSLGVVDEAIYAVQPEQAADITSVFFGRTYNRVGTDSSLSYYFRGEAGKRAPLLAQATLGVRAQLKPAPPPMEPRVRKAFPDTAYWVADLKSDASGHARATFSFPDSLTTWRATVRGVSGDTRVGAAVNKVLVRKNVILRLAAPRFFRQGDEVTVSAIVHNYLTSAKTARVSLEAQGLELVDGATRSVEIPSRGDAKVDWRFRATSVGQAKLLGKALTDEESDALEITAPVNAYGVRQAIARGGSLSNTQQVQQQVDFPQQIEPTSRTLVVSATPSIAGAIFSALEYLTSYPYGCTEQTMSSFLPNVIVAQASKELGVKPQMKEGELEKKVRAGLERLYDFQHEDGGWGWWKTDDSHSFMTAYVLAGLEQAKKAGYDVRQDSINRARGWLRDKLKSDNALLPDLRAYAIYALALGGEKSSAIDAAWSRRSDLSPYGLAFLGLAFAELKDSRADEAAAQLEKQAKVTDSDAWWQVARDPLLDFPEDATPETTAYAAKLLARVRPESPLLPKAASWLVANRDEGYWWTSTKQTAMVVYGLTDFLKRSGELKPNLTVRVLVNDRVVLTQQFTQASVSQPASTVRLNAGELANGNRVRVESVGQGRVYWSARAEYFSTADKLVNTGSFTLNASRAYFTLTPERVSSDDRGERIVYRLDPLSGPVAVGQIVAVRLTVSGGEWKYLLVEDPIPAGTEFIQRDDLYELKTRPSWWGWWFDRRELHDDRVAMFLRYFRQQREFVYLLKVVNPGKFRVSPGLVQPMYQPQYISTTDGKTVEVK